MKLIQKLFSKNRIFTSLFFISNIFSCTAFQGSQTQVETFKQTMFEAARAKGPTFEKLVKRYCVSDDDIAVILQCQLGNPTFFISNNVRLMPGSNLYRKGICFDRLVNAIRMRECIHRNNLSLIGLPEKKIAFVNGTWMIFAQAVESHPEKHIKKISLELLKELIVIAEETGYSDWHSTLNTNWIWTTDGKLTCVDTENISFSYDNWTAHQFYKDTLRNRINFVRTLKSWNDHMEQDARDYLTNYIKELEEKQSSMKKLLQNALAYFKIPSATVNYLMQSTDNESEYLPHSTQYDPAGINLGQIA